MKTAALLRNEFQLILINLHVRVLTVHVLLIHLSVGLAGVP